MTLAKMLNFRKRNGVVVPEKVGKCFKRETYNITPESEDNCQ
jgi:hypothetical protein